MITFKEIMEQHEKDKAEVAAMPEHLHRHYRQQVEIILRPSGINFSDPEKL